MNRHFQHRPDETCEWAALAALDALTPEETVAYERHLESGCSVCEANLRSFQEVVGRLGEASRPVRPSALLRNRLLGQISESAAATTPRGPGAAAGRRRVERFVISTSGADEGPPGPDTRTTFMWGRWLTAAAVFFVVCSGAWTTLQLWTPLYELDRASQETYIDSLYAKVAATIRIGLGDHLHCSVFRKFGDEPPTFEKMAKKMGPDWIGLVPLVQETVPAEYRVVLAHRCGYRGRKFVHLALKSETDLLSIVVTEKGVGEGFSQDDLLWALDRSGIGVYEQGVDGFETAGFESEDHFAFVVSDLTKEANLKFAAGLAPALHRFLHQLEA